jgi:hypothetical protein
MTNKILNSLQFCHERQIPRYITFVKKRPKTTIITLLFITLKRIFARIIKHGIKHNSLFLQKLR